MKKERNTLEKKDVVHDSGEREVKTRKNLEKTMRRREETLRVTSKTFRNTQRVADEYGSGLRSRRLFALKWPC
jgi:hypothetical protein